MSIYLTAIIKSIPGEAESLKTHLLELVSHSTKETACLQYDLHQADDKNTFIFHEEWSDAAGLELHNGQPHIQRFISNTTHLRDGDILIYKTQPVK
ncbi:Quinol monooxygenase YgiN [Mucilaginibacter lappiensis]|uniref:Quinol monooxygenase YgiN n=1 Tax=Mucilaginibacter lappiensis TaxID=354630 RepID=A0ABR6PRG4_9SPHI|nr:putative quinol monooxygenase [Mucilaginibacter lappiensis]MBB6111585.1 quinol monooxygenase YgiN [Mucilaginibacter lappiensis]SIR85074.1 Quinol monooxygenase YgiN [Mucilaginibacter lappiensis]